MSELKHTALPWSVDERVTTLVKGEGHSVATTGGYSNNTRDPDELMQELEANAQLIVTAVNNHAKLVEALREVAELDRMSMENAVGWLEDNCSEIRQLLQDIGEDV